MAKLGQIKSGTMRVGNTTSTGYGIVYADEIIGHRRVENFNALKSLPAWCLYNKAGGDAASTAIGQLWYVSTADSSHSAGLYQLTAADHTKDASWKYFKNGSDVSYSLPVATSETRGGIQIGYTDNGKNYAVKLDNEKAYVNVPWTDHNDNTTYTFKSGTNGSFSVTPSNGTAQTVEIGKPANATHADTATSATTATIAGKSTNDGNGNNIVNTYATKKELSNFNDKIDNLTGVLKYKGTIGTGGDIEELPTNNVTVGDTWVAIQGAPSVDGKNLEPGDMIIVQSAIRNEATSTFVITWNVVQANIDGAVTSTNSIGDGKLVVGDKNGRSIKAYSGTGFVKINNGSVSVTSSVIQGAGTGLVETSASDGTHTLSLPTETINKINSALQTVPVASTTTSGTIKVGAAGAHTISGKEYKVNLDTTTGVAYVAVPWTDTDTKYSLPTASTSVKGGIMLGTNTVQEIGGKTYAVGVNKSGQLTVNVPWTDNNTTYKADGTYITLSDNTFNLSSSKKSLIDGAIQPTSFNNESDSRNYYKFKITKDSSNKYSAIVPIRSYITCALQNNLIGNLTPTQSSSSADNDFTFLYRTKDSNNVMTGIFAVTDSASTSDYYFNDMCYEYNGATDLVVCINDVEYRCTQTANGNSANGNLVTLTPIAIPTSVINSMF